MPRAFESRLGVGDSGGAVLLLAQKLRLSAVTAVLRAFINVHLPECVSVPFTVCEYLLFSFITLKPDWQLECHR